MKDFLDPLGIAVVGALEVGRGQLEVCLARVGGNLKLKNRIVRYGALACGQSKKSKAPCCSFQVRQKCHRGDLSAGALGQNFEPSQIGWSLEHPTGKVVAKLTHKKDYLLAPAFFGSTWCPCYGHT